MKVTILFQECTPYAYKMIVNTSCSSPWEATAMALCFPMAWAPTGPQGDQEHVHAETQAALRVPHQVHQVCVAHNPRRVWLSVL